MSTQAKDALALLKQDHKEARQLFQDFEGLGERAIVSKKKLADQVCDALTLHTEIEEEIFYPAARACGGELEDMVKEALVEHAAAKELISKLQAMEPDDEMFDASMKVLSEQIDHHIDEEEKEMFPLLRNSDLDLKALGEDIAARKEEGIHAHA